MSGTKQTHSKGIDLEAVASEYRSLMPRYEDLKNEALFTLKRAIAASGIKIDSIEDRIKPQDSVQNKCQRTGKNLADLSDVVGLRVVALFRSDLSKLRALIQQEFDVLSEEDKTRESTEAFGYMSSHFDCRIKGAYSGPRYDNLKDTVFEIQLRTICMHAWAAVSHYLDYKSELDIPFELRKELNALSGLFYVADSQFESAYASRTASRSAAQHKAEGDSILDERLNLDTLSAYLRKRFDRREHALPESVSQLLRELDAIQITDVRSLAALIDLNEKAALDHELRNPPEATEEELEQGFSDDRTFTDVGFVRTIVQVDQGRTLKRTG